MYTNNLTNKVSNKMYLNFRAKIISHWDFFQVILADFDHWEFPDNFEASTLILQDAILLLVM